MIILLELYFITRVYLSCVYDNDWAPRSSDLTLVASGTLVERPNPKIIEFWSAVCSGFWQNIDIWEECRRTYLFRCYRLHAVCLSLSLSSRDNFIREFQQRTRPFESKIAIAIETVSYTSSGFSNFLYRNLSFLFFFFLLFPFKRRLIS